MLYRLAIVVLVAGATSGCRFDEGGLPGSVGGGGDASLADAPIASDQNDAATDAGPPDAAVPCVDRDGDGFNAVGIPGSECGDLDCDDDEPRAFPGQEHYFDEPAENGGFDFDCNGEEEKLYDQVGGACEAGWWGECNGTGYFNGLPECGAVGQWHACANEGGECRETSASDRAMPCR